MNKIYTDPNAETLGVKYQRIDDNFTKLARGYIKNAEDYGFLPSASATANTAALNAALLGGGTVFVLSGTYEMNDKVYLDDNTVLICEPGTILKKVADYTQVFLNRGALTKTYNENITIDGLEIEVNGHATLDSTPFGIDAHMGFYYCRNITIRNFKCSDADGAAFMFVFCRWENLVMDNIEITSDKDGIELYAGHDAVISNYICESRDDGTTLKTIDYPLHTPEVGDVYNVTFRNCVDRTPTGQSEAGYFCRTMGSSWTDWTSGFTYRVGDLCLNAGHLYQCHNANSFSGVGTVAPVHTDGAVTGADGVIWRYKQDSTVYFASIWNITFDACILTKNRTMFVAQLLDEAVYVRSAYPGTETLSTIKNVKIINCNAEYSGSIVFFRSDGNLRSIGIVNNSFDGINFIYFNTNAIAYASSLNINFNGNNLKNAVTAFINCQRDTETITCSAEGNISIDDGAGITLLNGSTLRMNTTDFPIHDVSVISGELGDICRDHSGTWIYKAGGWVNLAI